MERQKAGGLTNSPTTQAQIQEFELAYLNIYVVYQLLKFMKWLVLQS